MRLMSLAVAGGVLVLFTAPAFANGYGTDSPWTFETPQDQANLAVVQQMIQQKKAGMYNPANYTTNIGTQTNYNTNCTVGATTYGNYALNGQTANSPSTTGASSSAQGNANGSTVSTSGYTGTPLNLASTQSNTGTVGSTLTGNTTVTSGGPSNQALNNSQGNSGTVTAGVSNSTACSGMK
jgi:hypothetical protein